MTGKLRREFHDLEWFHRVQFFNVRERVVVSVCRKGFPMLPRNS